MILTGHKITDEVNKGNITIEPFDEKSINPNSYNYRLGDKLIEMSHFGEQIEECINIPSNGFVLRSDRFYLSTSYEILGSKKYAMSLIGKSSLGRLGLFLQISADLGHTGSCHKWTLELKACKPIKIYPRMVIGQITFWKNYGDICNYKGEYALRSIPYKSKIKL